MRSPGSIEDKVAIRELIEHYADAVFRRDAEQWAETWALDASWSISGQEVSGRGNIVALWREIVDQYPFVGMYLTGGGCSVNGDAAEGRWYVLDVGATASGDDLCIFGCYDDHYIRDADGLWRFASRRYGVLHVPGGLGKSSAAAVSPEPRQ